MEQLDTILDRTFDLLFSLFILLLPGWDILKTIRDKLESELKNMSEMSG